MVPLAHTSMTQHNAFSVVGPSTLSYLPSDLCALLAGESVYSFCKYLKLFFIARAGLGALLSRGSWRGAI